MKKIIVSSIVTVVILLGGSAKAKNIDKNTEANLVKICQALKSDSKLKLHSAIKDSGIKDSGIKIKEISEGLVFDGYEPVTFAIFNNAQNTAEFMARHSGADYEALLAKLEKSNMISKVSVYKILMFPSNFGL
jgi:hypothetical protein